MTNLKLCVERILQRFTDFFLLSASFSDDDR